MCTNTQHQLNGFLKKRKQQSLTSAAAFVFRHIRGRGNEKKNTPSTT